MTVEQEADRIRQQLNEENDVKVSVALFGQPGAGKSSIINRIVGKTVAAVGVETDKTVAEARYEYNGLVLVDLPGYGTSAFPKETYFDRFNVTGFDLFLCVMSGKLHQADTEFFQELAKQEKVCIFVVNKREELWEEGVETGELERRKIEDIEKHVGRKVRVVFTSCRLGTGLDELVTEIQRRLEGAKRERWTRGAKAYGEDFLASKKVVCEKYVARAAVLAAINGVNPVPGVDVSIDLAVLTALFKEIRCSYGLDDDYLSLLKKSAIPTVGRLANNVFMYAAKEGMLLLLKSVAGRQAAKSLAKYIPFVGQAISASVGYAITSNAGSNYLEDCHALAQEALRNHLGR